MPPDSEWGLGDAVDPFGPNDPLTQGMTNPTQTLLDLVNNPPMYSPNDLVTAGNSELDRLNGIDPAGRLPQRQKHIDLAHLLHFSHGLAGIEGVTNEVAHLVEDPGLGWVAVRNKLTATLNSLTLLAGAKGTAEGETIRMIFAAVDTLKNFIGPLSTAAERTQHIAKMFADDIGQTKAWFTDPQRVAISEGPDSPTKESLDIAAQITVRDAYNPPLAIIAQNHPDLPPPPPEISPDAAGTPTSMPSGPGPGGIPPGLNQSGLGLPDLGDKDDRNTDPNQNQNQPEIPTGALDSAGNAAQDAGNAATKTAEDAGSAAQDALRSLLNDKTGAELPGDAALNSALGLGLGANAVNALSKAGAGSGLRASPGTAKVTPVIKPIEPTSTTSKTSAAGAPSSRASLSSGSGGMGGSGAPAAGHGASADKQHKASKALRHDKYDLVEEGGAVVPVVGDESKPPPPPSPSQSV